MTQAVQDYGDGLKLTDGSTDVTFRLLGGLYGIMANATWGGGNVTLKGLSSDGTTYVTVATAITADGYATVYLPAGFYKADITTATALYLTIVPIPIRNHT